MKTSGIVTIIVAVIIVAGVGYVVYTNPSLFNGNKTASSSSTLAGMDLVSTNTVNSSMGGGWIEAINVTGGVGNLSELGSIFGATGIFGSLANNTTAEISSFQFAGFSSGGNSTLMFGFVGLASVSLADMVNGTMFGELANTTNTTGSYSTSGVVSGVPYIFATNGTSSGYMGILYSIYNQYVMYGLYLGPSNITSTHMTGLVSGEVTILKAGNINFKTSERLVQATSVDSSLHSSTWSSALNASLSIMNAGPFLHSYLNSTGLGSILGANYSMVNDTFLNISSLGVSAFYNGPGSSLSLGYIGMTSSTAALNGFQNFSQELNASATPGLEYGTTTSGVQYLNLSMVSSGGETAVTVGYYNSYLIFMAYNGTVVSQTYFLSLLDSEAALL